ncbi:MAG: hypothetical protein HYY06_25105 [Deltaproteobacteria bacterium]|nr:hypothetical protein [Deltaproteobacteria bacterium]
MATASPARALTMLLPRRVRRLAQRARTLWSVGAFSDPVSLMRQWRHRGAYGRLQRSLFYHRFATAILVGHETGVFESLLGGARSIPDVAELCGLHPRAAESLLRILESLGAVGREGDDWTLSEFGSSYLARSSPFSLSSMLDLMTAQASAFGELAEGLRTGRSPRALDIFSEDGKYKAFLEAVNSYLRWAARDLFHQIELPAVRTAVVGSMGVSFGAELLSRFPGARLTIGCLEHLVREVPRLLVEYNVPASRIDGIHSHGGDPTQDRWGGEAFDLVFLTKKMILEPDRHLGEAFARKAFGVLRPGGVAILWETLHTDAGPTPLGRAMEAVLDLGASPTAPARTEAEMRRLLRGIGYERIEIVPCLGGQTTFVVARKS